MQIIWDTVQLDNRNAHLDTIAQFIRALAGARCLKMKLSTINEKYIFFLQNSFFHVFKMLCERRTCRFEKIAEFPRIIHKLTDQVYWVVQLQHCSTLRSIWHDMSIPKIVIFCLCFADNYAANANLRFIRATQIDRTWLVLPEKFHPNQKPQK